jgi:hypothetical protein
VEGGATCSGDERDDVLKPILCVGLCQSGVRSRSHEKQRQPLKAALFRATYADLLTSKHFRHEHL